MQIEIFDCIVDEILRERERQEKLWGEQNHPIISSKMREALPSTRTYVYGIIEEFEAKNNNIDALKGNYMSWASILIEEVSGVY